MDLQHNATITSEDIYNDLCYKIEKLHYMPGQGISENELCKQYNVSRHMVRGALTKLKQRRLIEVLPQRGTFISLIDMKYIADILFLREAIEQEAVQRIIQSGNVKDVCKILKRCVKLQRQNWEKNKNSDEFYKLDTEFHNCILLAVGREEVLKIVSDPYIHIRRWRNFEVRGAERMLQLIEEHEGIVKAIEDLNMQAARLAMHSHLDTVGRYGGKFEESENQYFLVQNS